MDGSFSKYLCGKTLTVRDSELIFLSVLDDAVRLCNDRKNEKRKELKLALMLRSIVRHLVQQAPVLPVLALII